MKVLLVISDPLVQNISPVMAYEEQLAMIEAIAFHNHPVDLVKLYPPTWHHLRQTLLAHENPFDVIHFMGHGNSEGILLENELSMGDHISGKQLTMTLVDKRIRLVVLNVCDSESPAEILVQSGIPAVVATTAEITNSQAIVLTRELYGTLAAGQSLSVAMAQVQEGIQHQDGYEASRIPLCIGNTDLQFEISSTGGKPNVHIFNDPNIENLPYQSVFWGHQDKLHTALEMLSSNDVHLLKVVGIGGSGKTSFGVQVVRRSAWRFWGVQWIDLKNHVGSTEALLLSKLGARLQVNNFRDVLKQLSCVPLLIVLDNPDSLSDENQNELLSIIKQFPFGGGSKIILLTSSPLAIIDQIGITGLIQLGPLDIESALRCLFYSAQRRGAHDLIELIRDENRMVFLILEYLGNHPGLIELAVDLIQIVGLDEGLQMLSNLPESFSEKVEKLLSPSLIGLSPNEIQALHMAATFAGKFQINWFIEALDSKRDNLISLAKRGLICRVSHNHYWLPPIFKNYLRHQIGDDLTLALCHARFFGDLVGRLMQESIHDYGFSSRIEFDEILQEVRAAIEFCNGLETDESDHLVQNLVGGIRDYLHFQRSDWQLIQVFESAAIRSSRRLNDIQALGSALTSLGAAQAAQGKLHSGLESCKEGLELLQNAKATRSLSVGYGALGFIQRNQKSLTDAEVAYLKGLELARKANEVSLQIRHLHNLGTIARFQKNWETANQYYQEALAIAERAENKYLMASQLDMLGFIARQTGSPQESVQYHQRAYWIRKKLGDMAGLRLTITNLASTLKIFGRADEILEDLETALDTLEENSNNPLQRWLLLLQLGRVYRDIRQWDISQSYYQEALEIAQQNNYLKGMSICERGIGLIYRDKGDLYLAKKHLQKARDLPSDPEFASTLVQELQEIEKLLDQAKI